MRTTICVGLALFIGGCMTQAQYPTADIPTSEREYIAKVKTAAPGPIVSKAAITMMQGGKPRELQGGSNGYTCLIGGDGTPLCADQNAMEWLKATAARTAPPNKIGFIYMLAGDTGYNQPRSASAGNASSLGTDWATRYDRRAWGSRNGGLSKKPGRL
jgi:hypothetical protein